MLYGIYSYVIEKLCGLIVAETSVGLRVFFDGNFRRADCHFVSDIDTRSVILVTWPVCETWQLDLVTLAVTVFSCLDPVAILCSVMVESNKDMGQALAGMLIP